MFRYTKSECTVRNLVMSNMLSQVYVGDQNPRLCWFNIKMLFWLNWSICLHFSASLILEMQLMNKTCKLEDPEESFYGGNSRCEQNVYVSFKDKLLSTLVVLFKAFLINYWICKTVIPFETRSQKPYAQFPLICIEEKQIFKLS